MIKRDNIEKEIREFCGLNNITDIDDFICKCLTQGFNTIKYGISPQDNIQKENINISNTKKKRIIKVIEHD